MRLTRARTRGPSDIGFILWYSHPSTSIQPRNFGRFTRAAPHRDVEGSSALNRRPAGYIGALVARTIPLYAKTCSSGGPFEMSPLGTERLDKSTGVFESPRLETEVEPHCQARPRPAQFSRHCRMPHIVLFIKQRMDGAGRVRTHPWGPLTVKEPTNGQ